MQNLPDIKKQNNKNISKKRFIQSKRFIENVSVYAMLRNYTCNNMLLSITVIICQLLLLLHV